MKKNKKLFIVPGFGESVRSKNYRPVINDAKMLGFTNIPIHIRWKLHVPMSYFIRQAEEKILAAVPMPEDYILGFSFGAYIIAVLALKKKFKGYIFCSLSPYFKDDLQYIPEETKKYFGKIFMNSLSQYSFPKNSNGRAWFIVGDKDWNIAIQRTHKAYRMWKGEKEIHVIKSVGHELWNERYAKKIKTILKKL